MPHHQLTTILGYMLCHAPVDSNRAAIHIKLSSALHHLKSFVNLELCLLWHPEDASHHAMQLQTGGTWH